MKHLFPRITVSNLTILLILAATPSTLGQNAAAESSGYIYAESDSTETDSYAVEALSSSESQYNTYYRPEPLYKTPEAMAFQEYGRYGTDLSNGSVDISIPLHTVICRDLQIPISLHYGGEGIKVAEEASWVGLGWDLSVGGCINLIPAGQIDFLSRVAQWSDYLEFLNLEASDSFQKEVDLSDYTVMQDLANGMGERDFYSVNILGRSFLFFINPNNGEATMIGAEDEAFHISTSGVDDWIIKDSMGYAYEFSEKEYSLYDGAGMQKSAWYLSSITTPGGITATFRYEKSYVKALPQAYQWYDVQRDSFIGINSSGFSFHYDVPVYGSGTSYGNTEISKPWLAEITTDNQTVSFGLGERTDLTGAKRVDTIKVLDIAGDVVTHYHLNYGVFPHSTVGGSCPDTSNHLMEDSRNQMRLKLLSLSQISIDNTDSLTHVFQYNEKYPLPLKTSAAIDFWGYYNGQENVTANSHITDSRSLIPSLQDCVIDYTPLFTPESAALSTAGACRFSDGEKMVSGTLESITYPTGGKSVFSFEPHTFRSSPIYPLRNVGYSDISSMVEDCNYPADGYGTGPVTYRQINTGRKTSGYLTVTFCALSGKTLKDFQEAGANITVQPMASPEYKRIIVTLDSCNNVNLSATSHTETFPVTLENISYMLLANLPSDLEYGDGFVRGILDMRVFNDDVESGGAGLRIAAIENYDDNGSLTDRRDFTYANTDGSTSGNLTVQSRPLECRIKYIEHELYIDTNLGVKNILKTPFRVMKIHSGMISGPAITAALSRGPVSYSRVTETESDASGALMRKTVCDFNVYVAEEVFPDVHLLQTFGGAEICRKTVTGPDGDTLLTKSYDYNFMESASIKCNISIEDQYYERLADGYSTHPAPQYLVSVYPYRAYWRVLSAVSTLEHTPEGSREYSTSYIYNTLNRKVSEEHTGDGYSGTKVTYSYSVDYSIAPYTTMCSTQNHLPGLPVETCTYNLSNGTYAESDRTFCSYIFRPSKLAMLQLSSVQESVAGGELFTRESYTYSDDDGTLIGVVTDTQKKRSYLWSYGHTCPVAVIEGASYAELVSWLGSEFIASLSAAKEGVESLLVKLRGSLSERDVMVTTFTHRPLVGILSETRPNGEKVNYVYDKFNRLCRITDSNGDILETFTYSYN